MSYLQLCGDRARREAHQPARGPGDPQAVPDDPGPQVLGHFGPGARPSDRIRQR